MSVLAPLSFSTRVQLTASTQTWTVPTGVTVGWFTHCGSGGAGGGGTAAAGNAGNGGNGAQLVYKRRVPLTPADVLTITCPVAATGVNGANGNNGVDSTVTSGNSTFVISRAVGARGGMYVSNLTASAGASPNNFGARTNFQDNFYNLADGQIFPETLGGTCSKAGSAYDDLPAYQNASGTASFSFQAAVTATSSDTGLQSCGQSGPFGIGGVCANFAGYTTNAISGKTLCAAGGAAIGNAVWAGAGGAPTNCAATDYGCGGGGAQTAVAGANGGPGFCEILY